MNLTESTSTPLPKDLRSSISEVLPALEARALRLARSRCDAQDLVQETVVRALRFEQTFQRGTNVRAWMQQILQSVFISRCRRRARERRALERFSFDPTLNARSTSAPVLRCVSTEMHAAFSSLPERFRRVVELVDLADHSYREAAEVLGVPVGTVMSRLFRARRMLEAALTEQTPADRASALLDGTRGDAVKNPVAVANEQRAVVADAGGFAPHVADLDRFAA
jgi:RNA polymerase sigma-70 factor (ECF subfamily)